MGNELNSVMPFDGVSVATQTQSSALEHVEDNRAVTEVKAMFWMAQTNPRIEVRAIAAINRACQRPALAEIAFFSYQRGGKNIEGITINLAKTLALGWGGINYGVNILGTGRDEKGAYTDYQAFAMDMESLTRTVRSGRVYHQRRVGKGSDAKYNILDDPRDIREYVNSWASRDVRECIKAVIPADIIEGAANICKRTLEKGGRSLPLPDQIRNMLVGFMGYGITAEMLAEKLDKSIEQINDTDIINLRKTYAAIRDGDCKISDVFPKNTKTPKPVTKEEPEKKIVVAPTPIVEKVDEDIHAELLQKSKSLLASIDKKNPLYGEILRDGYCVNSAVALETLGIDQLQAGLDFAHGKLI